MTTEIKGATVYDFFVAMQAALMNATDGLATRSPRRFRNNLERAIQIWLDAWCDPEKAFGDELPKDDLWVFADGKVNLFSQTLAVLIKTLIDSGIPDSPEPERAVAIREAAVLLAITSELEHQEEQSTIYENLRRD